jgi:predicted nuclease of restriction endonuclease-like RecB superfamily
MLPLQLLRIKVSNKGKNISPAFCRLGDDSSYELKIATDMIKQFEDSFKKRETKGLLGERISLLEASYDDYKLVRGLYALLERRCIFRSRESQKYMANIVGNTSVINLGPFHIRKYLFEESSGRGYALTDYERKEIIDSVASKTKISNDIIMRDMWADLEENMVLEGFRTLEPEKLISWYNLSLMQTLLFNSTKLEFYIQGGYNWKRALRAVKRLGLMYNLHYSQNERPQEDQKKALNQKPNQNINGATSRNSAHVTYNYDNNIVCSIDGPLSIFKLTDRYGTSIAKLLPSITVSRNWSLKALIVRKTDTMGKKIYEFMISSEESPGLPSESDLFARNNGNNKNTILEKILPSVLSPEVSFDSSVEQKFALKFEQFSSGWKLIREPDPLIVSSGKGFIPDFAFEKYGIRVYLEIVGFWTNDYLVRKIQKIADIMSLSSSSTCDPSAPQLQSRVDTKDFFIAVNMDSYISGSGLNTDKVLTSLRLSDYIEKEQLIKYKNDNVPIKPILDRLRAIDHEMIERLARINHIKLVEELNRITLDNSVNSSHIGGIISLEKLAEKYDIPVESILHIIKDSRNLNNSNYKDSYIVEDKYLIPLTKINEIKPLLGNDIRYIDACKILAENQVPESCYSFILRKIGYDIIWHSMDINGATIKLQGS